MTTQGHFTFRNHCATLLGMDIAKLKVTSSEIGGGFGGKTHVWMEPVALALSRKANRPVKLVMTRDEVFRATGPTCSTSIDVKIGARKDGTITAAKAVLRYQDGAFPSIWGMLGAMTSFACYDLDNVKSIGYDVLVNRPKVAAYRAPSAPMAAFAVESTIDQVAGEDRHGSDRLPHQKRGQRRHAGFVWTDVRTDRHRPDAAGREKSSAHESAAREKPGPRHGVRVLVQLRRPDLH